MRTHISLVRIVGQQDLKGVDGRLPLVSGAAGVMRVSVSVFVCNQE